jgi:hypothetical protein
MCTVQWKYHTHICGEACSGTTNQRVLEVHRDDKLPSCMHSAHLIPDHPLHIQFYEWQMSSFL